MMKTLTANSGAHFSDPPAHINHSSPHWIGAWWLGFVVCGAIFLLFGLPIALFPDAMHQLHGVELTVALNGGEDEKLRPPKAAVDDDEVALEIPRRPSIWPRYFTQLLGNSG